MKLTIEPDGDRIDAEPGRTLLYTALSTGHDAPYECASGGCGGCRGRLISGEVSSLWPDAPGLTARDRRKGDRILLCQSVPRTDCTVMVADSDGLSRPRPRRHAATIVALERRNAVTLLVEIDVAQPFAYLPGQFAVIELRDRTRRAYSMSRPVARAASVLEFVVRAKPGGRASAALFGDLAPAGAVTIEGPYGKAHFRRTGRPVLCVGGGSGVGPMLAIAEHAATLDDVPTIDLYYGGRSDDDLVLEDRLDMLAAPPRARVHRVLERTTRHDATPGLVTEAVADEWPDLADHDIYLAGPPPMVDAALAALVRSGRAHADHVHFDRFT